MKSTILCSLAAALLVPAVARADDDARDQLEAAKRRATAQTYQLQYKFQPGETVRSRVVHLVTVKTTVKGASQTAKTRSASTKVWRVTRVDAEGNMIFTHQVDHVDMWQQVSGKQEIRFSSDQEEEPPAEYAGVAESVGKRLATVTISPHGKVVKREAERREVNLGMGGLVMPLPAGRVPLDHIWTRPHEVRVKLRDGRTQTIKARDVFKLKDVKTGVATILVHTQVLTPANDPVVRSQLIQQLSRGVIKFDVDAGRVLSKQMDWDEDVVGFSGPDSNMQYVARFTEELLDAQPEQVTRRPDGADER